MYTMKPSYSDLIQELNKLHSFDTKNKLCCGYLYLPSTKCIFVNDASTFDFSDFDEVSFNNLFDLWVYVHSQASSNPLHNILQIIISQQKYSLISLVYSLHSIKDVFTWKVSHHHDILFIQAKIKILVDDVKLLFTLSGAKFHSKNNTQQYKN